MTSRRLIVMSRDDRRSLACVEAVEQLRQARLASDRSHNGFLGCFGGRRFPPSVQLYGEQTSPPPPQYTIHLHIPQYDCVCLPQAPSVQLFNATAVSPLLSQIGPLILKLL